MCLQNYSEAPTYSDDSFQLFERIEKFLTCWNSKHFDSYIDLTQLKIDAFREEGCLLEFPSEVRNKTTILRGGLKINCGSDFSRPPHAWFYGSFSVKIWLSSIT